MKHVFQATNGIVVPDQTIVYPFLNSKDAYSGIPWDVSDLTSLAIGQIEPLTSSKLHIHPIVTLITWLIEGQLTIRMKEPDQPEPYAVELGPEQAALIGPGTILQHVNKTNRVCRVLYIVSPAYVYLAFADQEPIYDDAIVLDRDWDELEKERWNLPELTNMEAIKSARESAMTYLRTMRGGR